MKRLAAMVLAFLSFAGGASALVPDATPPTVTSVEPASGATNQDRDVLILVHMSEDIDQASLDGVKLKNLSTRRLVKLASVLASNGSDDFIDIEPDKLLPKNTRFKIIVPATVTDLAGNPLGEKFTSTFRTGTNFD